MMIVVLMLIMMMMRIMMMVVVMMMVMVMMMMMMMMMTMRMMMMMTMMMMMLMMAIKFAQCQTAIWITLRSSTNCDFVNLWEHTSHHTNIHYDQYKNTQQTLKAIQNEHRAMVFRLT